MGKRLGALFFLAWQLLALMWDKLTGGFRGHRKDKTQFLQQYKDDGLWSLSPAQSKSANRQGGCFHCGMCEAIFALPGAQKATTSETDIPDALPQSLFLGASRELSIWPTLQKTTGSGFQVYETDKDRLSALCPAGLSFREMQDVFMAIDRTTQNPTRLDETTASLDETTASLDETTASEQPSDQPT